MTNAAPDRLAFCIQNNHCMMPTDFFWTYNRMFKPNGSFAVEGNASIKCSMYNDSIYKALNLGAEWFFLMDVDHLYPINTIPKLFDTVKKYDAKIVSVLYHLGRAPFGPVAGWFKEAGEKTNYVNSRGYNWRLDYAPIGEGVVEVDWAGSGGLLIHKDVIEAIEWPPFIDTWSPGKGIRDCGHDINFCVRAKAKGFKVYVDTTVASDHGRFAYVGDAYARAFHENKMVTKIEGVLKRQTLEAPYWDMLWQTEAIKGYTRAKSYQDTLKDLEALIPKGSRVADIGCGGGAIMDHLREKNGCSCKGYDFSEKSVELIKAKGHDGAVADIRNFEVNGDAGKFDVVVSAHTIEHLQEDKTLVEIMKKLARPDGGKVIVVTPWREEIQEHFEHQRGYSAESLKELLDSLFASCVVTKNNRDFVAVGILGPAQNNLQSESILKQEEPKQ